MKRVILILIIVAVVAVIAVKLTSRRQQPQPPSATTTTLSKSTQGKPVFYLFHDPSDQDEGCRRIYAYADRAEREMAGKVEVRRPDVEREKSIMEQYQVRVLPTILLVSPTGVVEERFEGEDSQTAARIEQALERLKGTLQ
ncbi:MAG: thioredoxin domain-containing protein [Acidobacteriota bacterium]|nr:thioredoxin domain-containing protein [Blastocatellia bacterium]MDW8239748.1 thioredoxin domain-containing protein [Acidobacteriota bacterium]